MTGIKDDPAIAGYLSESLGVELLKLEFSVLTEAEQISLLRNASNRHKLVSPNEPIDAVIAEIAGGMGADDLVAGLVERIEPGRFVLVLKLIGVQDAKVINRASESYKGPVSQLPLALRYTLFELLGQDISGEGAIALVTDVEGRFQVDQNAPEPLPRPTPVTGLSAAKHDLQIAAEGYQKYFANFYLLEPSGPPPPKGAPLGAEY